MKESCLFILQRGQLVMLRCLAVVRRVFLIKGSKAVKGMGIGYGLGAQRTGKGSDMSLNLLFRTCSAAKSLTPESRL